MHGWQTGEARRSGPEDHYRQHQQRAFSAPIHGVKLPSRNCTICHWYSCDIDLDRIGETRRTVVLASKYQTRGDLRTVHLQIKYPRCNGALLGKRLPLE
jgi:hypothetical protein